MLTRTGPIVGRDGELATLETALAQARDGHGSAVVLTGEPGIGKTRLTQELRDRAEQARCVVIAAAGYESDWSPPFSLWSQVAAQLGPVALTSEDPQVGMVLSEILPAPARVIAARPAVLPTPEARFRLTDVLARLLLETAEQQPTLVVLDDLQWCEAASLDVLAYLARYLPRSRLLIVGTYREAEVPLDHPLARALAELDRHGAASSISLGPLRDKDALSLVRALGAGLQPQLAEEIVREASGHPFFITEVVRQLLQEDQQPARVSELSVPQGVRHAVGRRVAALAPTTSRTLAVAAALTRPFEAGVLSAMTGLEDDELLEAIDEAVHAQLLQSLGAGHYRFSHDLIRRTLYEEVGVSRRARLHRRLAQALERAYQGREAEHAGELAVQYHASASLPGAEHGIQYALIAADQAMAAHAPEQAVAALQIADKLAVDAAPALRCDIVCRRAIAEAEAFLVDEAEASAERALRQLEAAGADGEQVAAFTHAVARPLFGAWMQARELYAKAGSEAVVSRLVSRGLAALGDRHNLAWARLQLLQRPKAPDAAGPVNSGRWLGFHPEAVSIARTSGDEDDYASTLVGQEYRSRAELRGVLKLAESWTSPSAKLHASGVVQFGLMNYHGALRETVELATSALRYSEAIGALDAQLASHTMRSFALERLGQFDDAAADARQGDELLSRLTLGASDRELPRFTTEARVRRLQRIDWAEYGRFNLDAALERHGSPLLDGLSDAALAAEAFARVGDASEARRILGWILPAIIASEPTRMKHNVALSFAGGAVWELGDRQPAPSIRQAALAVVAAGVGDGWWTSNELTVARMSSLTGDLAESEEWFGQARGVLEASGHRPTRAMVDYDEARHRLRHQVPGAHALLAEARRRFEELGMTQWAEWTDALVEKARRADGLTAREAEILKLVANGLTNAEVADNFVISVHTVERHLANVYRKIGARNRAEAAAYAERTGL